LVSPSGLTNGREGTMSQCSVFPTPFAGVPLRGGATGPHNRTNRTCSAIFDLPRRHDNVGFLCDTSHWTLDPQR